MSLINIVTQKLLDYAIAHNFTSIQVENATWEQIKNQLNQDFPENFSGAELNKAQKYVAESLRDLERKAIKDQIKDKIKTWLDSNYPNYEFEYRHESGKLCIELWIFGKPEIDTNPEIE